jgi:hypothetical protein
VVRLDTTERREGILPRYVSGNRHCVSVMEKRLRPTDEGWTIARRVPQSRPAVGPKGCIHGRTVPISKSAPSELVEEYPSHRNVRFTYPSKTAAPDGLAEEQVPQT